MWLSHQVDPKCTSSAHQRSIHLDFLARSDRDALQYVGVTPLSLLVDRGHIALQEPRGWNDDVFAVHAESELATLNIDVWCSRAPNSALFAGDFDWGTDSGARHCKWMSAR